MRLSIRAASLLSLSLSSACSLFLDTNELLSENANAASAGKAPGAGGTRPLTGGSSSVSGSGGSSASGGTAGAGDIGGFGNAGGDNFAGSAGSVSGNGGVSGSGGAAGVGGNPGSGGVAGNGGSSGAVGAGCAASFSFPAGPMQHDIGRADDGGWSAFTAEDAQGYLAYQDMPAGFRTCNITLTFHVMVAASTGANTEVLGFGVWDQTTSEWSEWRTIYGDDVTRFGSPLQFTLGPFSLPAEIRDHAFDFDVYWYDAVKVRFDRVDAQLSP